MTSKEFLMLSVVVLASAGGQLLLRNGAVSWTTTQGPLGFIRSFFRGSAPFAVLLVFGAPFLYWKVLETVPLSLAYAVTALTGVLIQIGGRFILREKPSRRIVAGALLCCAGIAVWGL
jgi:drug/metabolite transporter (DMT)-like permease